MLRLNILVPAIRKYKEGKKSIFGDIFINVIIKCQKTSLSDCEIFSLLGHNPFKFIKLFSICFHSIYFLFHETSDIIGFLLEMWLLWDTNFLCKKFFPLRLTTGFLLLLCFILEIFLAFYDAYIFLSRLIRLLIHLRWSLKATFLRPFSLCSI